MSGGRGRGRGRKAKSSKTEGLALSPLGVAGAEDKMLVAVQPRELLTTPLTALLRIEATIWMSKRGGGSMSIEDFYVMAKSHEWLGINSSVNADSITNNNREGDGADDSNISTIQIPKAVADLSNVVHGLINKQQLSEEERLLFDFMVVSSWDPKVISSNLYPIYKLDSSTKAKGFRIEILQQPQTTIPSTVTTTKSINKVPTRSEVIGAMYHHTCKYLSFEGAEPNNAIIQSWWIHAKNVAQVILDHRELMIATATNIKNKVKNKPFSKSLVTNGTTDSVASTNEMNQNGDKKMTLEERVRARSLLNPANAKKKTQQRSKAGISPHQYESKAILELANALRSYSNSRGSVSSGGNSALDRLKLKSAASGSGLSSTTAKNVARLTVSDLIKDARITWHSVVNESIEQRDTSGGNKARPRGGGGTIVAIDLSRVLFQLRLKMISKKDISDKRQMENELLGLLEKLAELVPTWINLRKAPTLLTGGTSKKSDSSASTNQPDGKQKFNIRQSIIVIRNDDVDYNKVVRAKLGGQVNNSNVDTTTSISNNQRKVQVSNGKRSFEDMKRKSKNIGVADAIVPPSFEQLYGKALNEKPKRKAK